MPALIRRDEGRAGDKTYQRKFRASSSVNVISDTTGSGDFVEDRQVDARDPSIIWQGVAREFWSSDNLRATGTFTVTPED